MKCTIRRYNIMMNANEIAAIDMHDFDAWSKHIDEEFDHIMAEYEKTKKEIEESNAKDSNSNEIDNGMFDHMMLVDQQNNLAMQQLVDQQHHMIDEDRRITEQNNFFMDQQNIMIECNQNFVNQQNLMMINMLHHGF